MFSSLSFLYTLLSAFSLGLLIPSPSLPSFIGCLLLILNYVVSFSSDMFSSAAFFFISFLFMISIIVCIIWHVWSSSAFLLSVFQSFQNSKKNVTCQSDNFQNPSNAEGTNHQDYFCYFPVVWLRRSAFSCNGPDFTVRGRGLCCRLACFCHFRIPAARWSMEIAGIHSRTSRYEIGGFLEFFSPPPR